MSIRNINPRDGNAVVNMVGEQPEASSSATAGGGTTLVSWALRLLGIGPVLILIVLAGIISLLTPDFLKPGNLSNAKEGS